MEQNKENLETTEETVETAKKKKKTTTSSAQAELATLKAENEKLLAEAKEKDDKYLRLAAEYDNFRRRSREEKDATYGNAVADTVSQILPIIDNLERAASFSDGEKVAEGIRMIASSVSAALANLGIESFGNAGEKFDPNLHNAVLHEEDDSDRDGEITEVFQKGYKIKDKIIRYASVSVVK